MIILDEDIDTHQRHQLEAWRIHFRYVGAHIGWSGMKDRNDVIPMLHRLRRPTFFSRDHGFYDPELRHHGYCLVHLDVNPNEAAEYIRRLLRNSSFRTQAERMGKVIRARHSGLTWWESGAQVERARSW